MEREIIKIDRELCNGCGICIPNCHEGALQMIDNKATLVSELMCDGLGACIGHCPVGAITIEKREAAAYDEVLVIKEMIPQGKNVIIAHLKHLKEHNQTTFLKQAVKYLNDQKSELNFDLKEVIEKVHNLEVIENKPIIQTSKLSHHHHHHAGGGCPGAREISFVKPENLASSLSIESHSELRQWPVQMHLISPYAAYFPQSDFILVADCVAFALGNFHAKFLKGKTLGIACPKLDSNTDIYIEKLIALIDEAKINTITVMMMEVPCCGGLLQMAKTAMQKAKRKVPLKKMIIGLQGEVLQEEWQ